MKILIKKNKLTGPADPKLHNLHDTVQQQDNQEESQWGTTGFLARPVSFCNEHLQVNMYG